MSGGAYTSLPDDVITVQPNRMYEQFSRCIHGDVECWRPRVPTCR